MTSLRRSEENNMRWKWIFIVPLAIVGMLLVAFIGGEIVMHLWNWLLPPLFGWRQLTFWQGLGLLALCRILFGGFGGHRSGRPGVRNRMRGSCEPRTPEEREQFRRRMRERFGFGPTASENKAQ
jgi:hypothetical protein